jgi:hypothetical protein
MPKMNDKKTTATENSQSREELAVLGATVESVKEMVASGDYIAAVAEKDGQPVGFAMARISEGYVFACDGRRVMGNVMLRVFLCCGFYPATPQSRP